MRLLGGGGGGGGGGAFLKPRMCCAHEFVIGNFQIVVACENSPLRIPICACSLDVSLDVGSNVEVEEFRGL